MNARTVETARQAVKDYPGAAVEIIGAWVWVTFDAKPDDETRASLKGAGFRWSARRGQWANACGVAKRARMRSGHPRDLYGSVRVDDETGAAVAS
jgi:hypothetical protein